MYFHVLIENIFNRQRMFEAMEALSTMKQNKLKSLLTYSEIIAFIQSK